MRKTSRRRSRIGRALAGSLASSHSARAAFADHSLLGQRSALRPAPQPRAKDVLSGIALLNTQQAGLLLMLPDAGCRSQSSNGTSSTDVRPIRERPSTKALEGVYLGCSSFHTTLAPEWFDGDEQRRGRSTFPRDLLSHVLITGVHR